jgi:FMN phosphatase YigB (HAD superfamily)
VAASGSRQAVLVDGKLCDARSCFAESLRVFTEGGMEAERARTMLEWSRYEDEKENHERSRELLREAETLYEQLGMKFEAGPATGSG